ncbi:hypothetical protein ES703_88547 [subsurface metagenome]
MDILVVIAPGIIIKVAIFPVDASAIQWVEAILFFPGVRQFIVIIIRVYVVTLTIIIRVSGVSGKITCFLPGVSDQIRNIGNRNQIDPINYAGAVMALNGKVIAPYTP